MKNRPTRLSRAEQTGQNHERVLEAARRVFLAKGFHVATLDQIANEAGFSKGVIYSLLRERFGQPVELAIDINPEKWGHYLPATGVQVIPPHSITEFAPTGTQIVVMNPNYASEINAATGNQFQLIGVDGEPI